MISSSKIGGICGEEDDDEISIVNKLNENEIHEQICQNILDNIIDIIEIVDDSVARIENNEDGNFTSFVNQYKKQSKRQNSVTSEEFREVISKLDENIEENDEGEEEGKCRNIIQTCVYHLKQLLHNFIHSIIFEQTNTDYDYFTSLFHSNSIIRRQPSSSSIPIIEDSTSAAQDNSFLKFKQNSFEYLSSFKQLNKFLIKLFLFPRAYANNQQLTLIFASNDLNQNYHQFEDWLKDLFIISCCLSQNDNENIFEFQSITINTLLEFFFISESFYSSLTNTNDNSSVKLLVTTVFTHKQLSLIYNESNIGEIIGSKLWSYLSHKPNNSNIDTFKYHKRAATLFCLLHELLPNNLCEDIISKSLNGDETMQLDTIRRFIHLWHWSKELQNNTTQQQQSRKIVKTFERCVFMLIDLIDKSTSPVNKLIQEWLNKSINDGDLCRILDILIISLLHPNTTRLSVQFYNKLNESGLEIKNSQQTKKVSSSSSDDYESKVYAISNEKGNVVYHVNNEISDRLKNVAALDSSRLNHQSANNVSGKSSKIKSSSSRLELPNLRVNPFSPKNEHDSTDDEIDDDDDDDDGENKKTKSSSMKNVRRVLSENNFIEKYRALKKKATIISDEESVFDLIDENYAYMLLYSQSYDNIRVLFVLKSFDKILKQCKKELIVALCKTKIFDNEIQTFYNTKLLDLFIRHLKSIYGHNFYSNSNSEFLQQISKSLNLKNLTYLEMILFIIMFYIRSFSIQNLSSSSSPSPDSKHHQTAEENVCGNKNVQIYCIQILSKLIQELINISQNINSNILQFEDLTQFSKYIYEMLDKCKIQKTLLHCLFSTTSSNSKQEKTLTRVIIEENLKNINQQTQYAFICELINCIQNLINLEYVLSATGGGGGGGGSKSSTPQKTQQNDTDDYLITKSNSSEMKFYIQPSQTSTQTSRYIQYLPIISQSMFISSVLYYLRHLSLFEFHLPILNLIRNSLPFTGIALKSWSAFIVEQLSSNLMQIVNLYEIKSSSKQQQQISDQLSTTLTKQQQKQFNLLSNINIPDFFVLIVKQLSCLLHFSLLITNFIHLNNSTVDNSTPTTSATGTGGVETTIHESFQNDATILIKSHKQSIIDMDSYQAKDSLTNHLPSILSRMVHIWKVMNQSEAFGNDHSAWFLGNPKVFFFIKKIN